MHQDCGSRALSWGRSIRGTGWATTSLLAVALVARGAVADAYDPPVNYYGTATGTGATLKSQLHNIIDGHTVIPYNSSNGVDTRRALQVTDATAPNSGSIYTVYDLRSMPLNVAAINPGGSIPGWDSGTTWNREHTWPRSRGVGSSGPDDSDLFNVRPSLTAHNGDRGSLNFGGAYGISLTGVTVTDGGSSYWYPGDSDAGMIARQMFYMAVRYETVDGNDLEIASGDPNNPSGDTDLPPQLGNLTRLLEWHYIVVPDEFERRRNQIIYDDYQHNRDPFIDHPEYVWSVFVDQTNDSQIAIDGASIEANGGSSRDVDLGRVFVGGAVPAGQVLTLNKSGNDGTYFEVTTAGSATSSLSGRFNAFRTNQTDAKSITVGLNTTTSSAGLKNGAVTIDNLDITTGGGAGHGANDANDSINVNLTVLDHATPSFDGGSEVTTLMHDFGSVAQGSMIPAFGFDVFNLGTLPAFTAELDFDSFMAAGDTGVLIADLAGSAGTLHLAGGTSHEFAALLDTSTPGMFSATYTLSLSDEDLPGALTKSLTLTLVGEVTASLLAGDYNRDHVVDAADYTYWRNAYGSSVAAYEGADGNGNMLVDDDDYQVWKNHFGETDGGGSAGTTASHATVPEPTAWLLALCAVAAIPFCRR